MKKKKFKIIVTIIMLLAIAVRVIYVVKTPYTEIQHDLDPKGDGWSYMGQLAREGTLPSDNRGQHYHPPFHQMVSAVWLKIGSFFTNDMRTLYESLQFLTVTYTIIVVFIVYKILKELKIDDKIKILVLSVMAFHPSLIIISGSINNDNLCFMLMVWAMLRLIKWYKKSNIKNTIFLAIITGLAVMTKTTGAIISVPIMYVFLLKLYREFKKSENKKQTIKNYVFLFAIFGLISLPIGLWYSVRNYILFGQPILYVMKPKSAPRLYIGNYSLISRYIPISKEMLYMYFDPWNEHNVFSALLKCSLFGEWDWGTSFTFKMLYSIAIIINIILIVMTIIYIIKLIINKNKTKRNRVWIITNMLLFMFNIISYILLNIRIPYGCTMDFRYMLATLYTGAVLVGFYLNDLKRYNKKEFDISYTMILALSLMLFIASDIIILC